MPSGTPDRRVRRTKRRLKEALMELLAERDYDAITIRELTVRADVGRSTFYSHYDSKEELLFSGFDEWLRSLARATDGGEEPSGGAADGFRFSLPLLRHARDQGRFFRATVERASSPRVRRRIVALVAEAARLELEGGMRRGTEPGPELSRKIETPLDARAQAVAGAFLGLLSWWLDAGAKLEPEAVDRIFQRTVAGPGAEPT